ncbi:FBLI1 protein, partial [Nycticryphes semicollaris]|nr:FBLI1 protein [Nycticryphes semicollaris]
MLPRKAEKRMASSIFITLVPPRREVATKEPTPRDTRPVSAEVPATHVPRTPTVPNGGEGATTKLSGHDCDRVLQHIIAHPTQNPPRLAFPAETHPAGPVLSSPPVLLLSEAPQPLSAEALGPALQQLDLAAPTTLQAPSALPAELRPPKSCQEEAEKPQWQDVNGYPERDGSRGKGGWPGGTHMHRVGLSLVGDTVAPSHLPDICAFCHKALGPQEPTVEAMGKQYHADCFTCRTCQRHLAGQHYYQRDGRPTCDACYQATLEKCAKCQGLITECIIRALGKGYHPDCFSCTTCGRAIGAETFAVDEQDKVYCVDDFYRKYAAVCGACEQPIVPCGNKDTYKIECLGRSFHEGCYCCESCRTPLSPEPTEKGCYPLGDHLLCKSCHVRRRNESSC